MTMKRQDRLRYEMLQEPSERKSGKQDDQQESLVQKQSGCVYLEQEEDSLLRKRREDSPRG